MNTENLIKKVTIILILKVLATVVMGNEKKFAQDLVTDMESKMERLHTLAQINLLLLKLMMQPEN